jgi:adenylate cyclase
MGDGLLAIFPVGGSAAEVRAACGAPLTAACEVRANIATSDIFIELGGGHQPRFGLALHVGEVLYGNIGGGNRLDFTCIGPAVNLAARIEGLTGRTGHPILASGEFAKYCGQELVPVGEYPLRGFGAVQAVFRPADHPGC